MAKLIRKIKSDFTVVHNQFIDDKNLYNESIGLLLKMLKLPDNWHFSVKGLTAICKDGERKITRQLHELEQVGYLVRKCIKSESGQILNWEYLISDEHLPEDLKALSFHYKQQRKKTVKAANQPHPHLADVDDEDMEAADIYKIKREKIKERKICSIRQSSHKYNSEPENEIEYETTVEITKEQNNCHSEQQDDDDSENDTDSSANNTEKKADFDSESFKKQIGYNRLIRDQPSYSAQFSALVEIVRNVFNNKQTLRVSGRRISPQIAKTTFSKLRYEHIMQVLEAYNRHLRDEKKPNNPRAYLLTMLYNSVEENENRVLAALENAAPEKKYSFNMSEYMDLSNRFDFIPIDNDPEGGVAHEGLKDR